MRSSVGGEAVGGGVVGLVAGLPVEMFGCCHPGMDGCCPERCLGRCLWALSVVRRVLPPGIGRRVVPVFGCCCSWLAIIAGGDSWAAL